MTGKIVIGNVVYDDVQRAMLAIADSMECVQSHIYTEAGKDEMRSSFFLDAEGTRYSICVMYDSRRSLETGEKEGLTIVRGPIGFPMVGVTTLSATAWDDETDCAAMDIQAHDFEPGFSTDLLEAARGPRGELPPYINYKYLYTIMVLRGEREKPPEKKEAREMEYEASEVRTWSRMDWKTLEGREFLVRKVRGRDVLIPAEAWVDLDGGDVSWSYVRSGGVIRVSNIVSVEVL